MNNKIQESNKIFLDAAINTINIANELTSALKDKIYDQTEQINKISELIYDGMILVDDSGKIFSSNKASLEIFGYQKEEMIGLDILDLIDYNINEDIMNKLYDIITSRNPNPYELFCGIKKDKSKFYIDVSIARLTRSDDSIYYLMIIRDTSDRVLREQILKNLFDSYDVKSAIVDLDFKIIYSSIEFTKEFDDIDNLKDILNEDELKDILNLKDVNYGNEIFLSKKIDIDDKEYIIVTVK